MIELLKGFPENIVAVSCEGKVTKSDYDTVLVPTVEKALKTHDMVRLYYEGRDRTRRGLGGLQGRAI